MSRSWRNWASTNEGHSHVGSTLHSYKMLQVTRCFHAFRNQFGIFVGGDPWCQTVCSMRSSSSVDLRIDFDCFDCFDCFHFFDLNSFLPGIDVSRCRLEEKELEIGQLRVEMEKAKVPNDARDLCVFCEARAADWNLTAGNRRAVSSQRLVTVNEFSNLRQNYRIYMATARTTHQPLIPTKIYGPLTLQNDAKWGAASSLDSISQDRPSHHLATRGKQVRVVLFLAEGLFGYRGVFGTRIPQWTCIHGCSKRPCPYN